MTQIPLHAALALATLYSPDAGGVFTVSPSMERGDASDAELSSVELVRRARAGDRVALDRIFARYLPILRRWAGGRLPRWARDMVDTDDLIQDALTGTFNNIDKFVPRNDGALAAYLRLALNNRIRDEIRKVRSRPRREEIRNDHRDDEASPLEAAIGREAVQKYEDALLRLADEDRELIVARIELGLSYAEVATSANKPSADAARMAVGRALARLATEMGHE
jgi:RNA polymerase sigma factor (sigma-70 family)